LVHRFISAAAADFRKGNVEISYEAIEQLVLFPWPGNIRQLQNEIRRMVALAEPNSILTVHDLSAEIASTLPTASSNSSAERREEGDLKGEKLRTVLGRIECEMVKGALQNHHGRVDAAAKALGISRKGLYLKRQRFGLE